MIPSLPFWVVFWLFPKNGTLKFQWFLGCSKNRLFVDLGTEKHQKRRSNWHLFEALSGDSDFLKNVLPPTWELDSRGCTLPRIDQKVCVFQRFEPRPFRNLIFAFFLWFWGPSGSPKTFQIWFLGFLGGIQNVGQFLVEKGERGL